MTYIHLFSFLVEAIILLQYTSALFVPKQKNGISFRTVLPLSDHVCRSTTIRIHMAEQCFVSFPEFYFPVYPVQNKMAGSIVPFFHTVSGFRNVRADDVRHYFLYYTTFSANERFSSSDPVCFSQ